MGTKVVSDRNPEKLFTKASEALVEAFSTTEFDREIVLGMCGGRSIVGLLAALRDDGGASATTLLSRTHFFMVDERLVDLNDEQSNFKLINDSLLQQLQEDGVVKERQVHPFVYDRSSSDYGVRRYIDELGQFGGRFDGVVLGIGEDGHVAGLFPHHPVLESKELTFEAFSDSPKPPAERVTATIPLIQTAQVCLFMAIGEGKREAYQRWRSSSETIQNCPAIFVKNFPHLIVITDLEDS